MSSKGNKTEFKVLPDEIDIQKSSEEISKPSCSTLEIESNSTPYEKDEIVIGDYDQAPEFLKDNEYIIGGYRTNCFTVTKVLRSLFMCHNETINVWSHLLGTIGVIMLIVFTAVSINANKHYIKNYDYQNLITEIKGITDPFLDSLSQSISGSFDEDVFSAINSIKNKTSLLFKQLSDKYNNISERIQEYFDSIKKIISATKTKISLEKSKHFLNNLTTRWGIVQNKILDVMRGSSAQLDGGKTISKTNFTEIRRWPLFIMLSSAIVCLGCSTLFHWFGALSDNASSILSRLDYAGISILVAGSCYPPYFYYFYCETFLCTVYLSFMSIFAISVFLFTLSPDFHVPSRRRLRGTLFLTLGLSAAIPMFHLVFFGNTVTGFDKSPKLLCWYLGGISYVVGALIYLQRIPERFRPRKHDIFGASHQIFHVLVVCGVVFHYIGCVQSYYYRAENTCPNLGL